MFKVLKADKDAYITDRVIDGVRSTSSNVGLAGSLDLFKLYGMSMSGTVPNLELSRLLIHFDLSSLQGLVSAGKIDLAHPSFWARMQLTDVYGGQACPDHFTVRVNPLARDFEEGHGKDVVYYGDYDVCNFITASVSGAWIMSGANAGGSTGSIDYYDGALQATQYFTTGEEDLSVDVTGAVRSILTGAIGDHGWRVSFGIDEEADDYTYFVKRFASRHAYDDSKHPRLFIGFDDSLRDSSQGMTLDSTETLFMFNYDHGTPAMLMSASSQVAGRSSLVLKMRLAVSGGFYELPFVGGQHYVGWNVPVTGIYSASVTLPSSDPVIAAALAASGSVLKFTPVWGSLDGTVSFLTGSKVTVVPAVRGSVSLAPKKFVVTVSGLQNVHRSDETIPLRVNVFDYTSPLVTVAKLPANSPGALQGVVSDAFYSIRDAVTQDVVIPFDTVHGSTRVSSDAGGLFFTLDASNLDKERAYVVDILLSVAGQQQRYSGASAVFKVSDVQ